MQLPTGKDYISYSELKAWLDCGWRHKLAYIDKVRLSKNSIYADFGRVMHSANENFLKTRVMDVPAAVSELRSLWVERNYPGDDWPPFASAVPDLEYWVDSLTDMLNSIPAFMEENFPTWEYVAAEELLFELGEMNVVVKGYIDGIIKVTEKGKIKYHIIDWKTTGAAGWMRAKKRDPKVQMQLVFYKYIWSQKHGVPLKDIKCHFVFVKRHDVDPKKRMKARGSQRCSSMTVSVGPKTVERAQKTMRNAVKAMQRGLFIKNKLNCSLCDYKDTKHCPSH